MSLTATALVIAGPASAASTQSISLSPCNSASCSPQSTNFAAGSSPSVTASIALDQSAGAPQSVTVTLESGLLGSLAANLNCLTKTAPDPSCQVGSGTLTLQQGNTAIPMNAYLGAASDPKTQIADLLLQTTGTNPTTLPAPISLVQQTDGSVQTELSMNVSGLASVGTLANISLSLNGTLNGQPFIRLPSGCSPADPTSVSVLYGTSTTPEVSKASPDATPTGCPTGETFTPELTALAKKDSSDNGVAIRTIVTQPSSFAESANKGVTLTVPSGTLSPNLLAAAQEFGKQVGTASATTPLLGATPLNGVVTLTGSATAPALTITFPAPTAFSFSGTINLGNNSVDFANVPDVPLTNLTVTLSGGPGALFITSCQTPNGTLTGQFIPHDGAGTVTRTTPLDVVGCPAQGGTPPPKAMAPTLTGASLTGVAKGKAVLRFTLSKGAHAKSLRSFSVKLPNGLRFIKKGLRKGVRLFGARIRSEKLSHGQLVITLKSAVSRLKVKIGKPALMVAKPLQKKVRAHKVKSLKGLVTAKDTSGKSTKLTLKLTHIS